MFHSNFYYLLKPLTVMQKIYCLLTVALCLMLAGTAHAQTFKLIPASADPSNPTDIFPVIMGDTTAAGVRTDNNTIYQLANGVVYVTSGRLVNTADWTLHLEAQDLTNTESKPILSRQPNTSGTYPDIMRPEGDVTLKNLWIVAGETGPLEQHDWGRIRISGVNSRVVVEDCIIEKDRGGFLQIRADGIKCFINNTIFRNGGNRRILEGNGRGIDGRNFYFDTLVMTNTVIHNIQDRIFRSQGAVQPHNYIEIDHCTSFNTIGRHGHIQLGRVLTAKITNNVFVNPIMMGTSPVYTDEQTQPDGDQHKVITVDTLYANTSLTVAGNNIFWTQDVIDYWGTQDSVSMPPVLSELIKEHLGDDTTAAFFQEVLTLDNVPSSILQYVKDVYADPTATDMYDFIVEDIAVDGTPFDSGNLFDLSELSTCYPDGTQSATGGTAGGPIGTVAGCNFSTSIFGPVANDGLGLTLRPNPVHGLATFHYDLNRTSAVSLQVYDQRGRVVAVVNAGVVAQGAQTLEWTPDAHLGQGLYLAKLQTEAGVQTLKFWLN
jgi:hypothetical protein